MTAQTIPVDPFELIVFGGTGDLSRRKLLPALCRSADAGHLNERTHVVGLGRGKLTDGEFRTNLAAGGRIDLSGIPDAAQKLAREAARRCGWDDVGIDICAYQGEYYILEANMKYGREGFREAGMNYHEILANLISEGVI